MKKWLYYFRFYFIVIFILLIILGAVTGIHMAGNRMNVTERQNSECLTEERVFDKADKLTDREEEKLRKLIAKREKQTGCDIVLVTLREPLKEYAESYKDKIGYIGVDEYVMVYADNFYDENKFGHNAAYGDGVIYVDNWEKESDGYRYSWFGTSGKAESKYSTAMIGHLVDRVIRVTDISPYLAYKTYINSFYYDMNGFADFTMSVSIWIILLVPLGIALFFVWINITGDAGSKNTTANTYVNGGNSHVNQQEDVFMNKVVTQIHIQTSSGGSGGRSGGGGGHHTSSGGRSHGGGGGRH